MFPSSWIDQARQRIQPHIINTPLTYDQQLDIYIKWENHQVTGSFKARGALNKVLSLQDWELKNGLVTASAGNHGQGVALAAKLMHAPVTVFASDHAQTNKLEAMRQLGAEIRLVPGGYGEAERAGIESARSTGTIWISPYNDAMIIAGQGTIAVEVLNELQESRPLTWVVPAGGGGLVSGIGTSLQNITPKPVMVAVQSEASAFLHQLYHYGTQAGVVENPSLADGLAGPVEEGSVTIPIVQSVVNNFLLVTEMEISQAIKYAWNAYHEKIEGSSAVTLAAVLTGRISQRPVVLIITGGNIEPTDHEKIINGESL